MIEEIQYTVARFTPLPGNSIVKHKFDFGERDIKKAITLVDLNDYKYFWFEDRKNIIGKSGGVITVESVKTFQCGTYFIDAYIETYEDVLVNNKLLADKMDEFGWTHIVRGINDYWTEIFRPDFDKLISLRGEIENAGM